MSLFLNFLNFYEVLYIFFPKKLEKSKSFKWWKMKLKPNMFSFLVFLLA